MAQTRQMVLSIACGLLCSVSISAQGQRASQTQTYGTSDWSSVVINAWDFEVLGGTVDDFGSPGRYFVTTGVLASGVSLPNGAVIQAIEVQGCDGTASDYLLAQLWSFVVTPPTANWVNHASVTSGATVASVDGCQKWSAPVPDVVVDNANRSFFVRVSNTNSTSGVTISLQAVRVRYRLQISPAPGIATFADVPLGDPFHRFVEALVSAGITGGCGGGNYCPNAPVTRGQMAVFLAAALGLHWPN